MNPTRFQQLSEICPIKYGKGLPKKDRRVGDVPVMGSNGQVDCHTTGITNSPCIVIGRKGSIGQVHFVRSSCWPIDTAYYLDEWNGKVDPEFLFFYLQTAGLNSKNKVGAIPSLLRPDLEAVEIPLPPLEEQRRIVARIKECMERVEEIERLQRSALDEALLLPTAFRYELWNECVKSAKMIELRSITTSTKNGLYKPRKFHGQGMVLLRMFNINDASLNLDRIERLEVSKKEASDYLISNGDIIVSRVNSRELVGKSALVEGLQETTVHEAMIIRLRVCEAQVDNRFLVWLINSPQFLYDLRGRAKHAIGQSSINQEDLLSSKIPLPSIEEQRSIVDSMNDLMPLGAELVTECIERLATSMGLRESILRKAFAGEL